MVLGVAALAAAWFSGVLSPVTFTDRYEGPFFVVYEDHVGAYPLIEQVVKDVSKRMDDANLPYTDGFGQFYDDPKTVPADKLRSIGGVLVSGVTQVDSPMAFGTIQYDHYAIASFKGLSMLGPSVVYPKAVEWMKANNKTLNGAVIEIYKKGGLKKEVIFMFPIN